MGRNPAATSRSSALICWEESSKGIAQRAKFRQMKSVQRKKKLRQAQRKIRVAKIGNS